jgi:hypothetical protein
MYSPTATGGSDDVDDIVVQSSVVCQGELVLCESSTCNLVPLIPAPAAWSWKAKSRVVITDMSYCNIDRGSRLWRES